jgi:hypothetical protein
MFVILSCSQINLYQHSHTCTDFPSRVRRDIRFKANIGDNEANFIRFEANKTFFIGLFRIEENQRILHAKRIKTEPNIPFYAKILFISLQSEYFEAK